MYLIQVNKIQINKVNLVLIFNQHNNHQILKNLNILLNNKNYLKIEVIPRVIHRNKT